MANTRELRRRIKSVKNTSQITKAMQMVAATKMRRAQLQALSGRPYSQALGFALSQLIPNTASEVHQLLDSNTSTQIGVILITTDKSLCGALNANVLRLGSSFIKEKKNLSFFTIGKKGRNFIVRTGSNLEADFENLEIVTFRQASQIARIVTTYFLENKLGEVYLIYPDFVSTLRQEPKLVRLLPISVEEEEKQSLEFIFEPNVTELLDYILNHYIETKVYQALLETKASEHSARMIAMQNATENANELVADLQLTYNQTRQEGITRELLEITSASAALES